MNSRRYDSFWAEYLGIATSELNSPGTSIAKHAALRGYEGVWFFRRNTRLVISAPADLVTFLRNYSETFDASNFEVSTFYEAIFAERFDRLVGPAYQGCLSQPVEEYAKRPGIDLYEPDASAVIEKLSKECGPRDWSASGLGDARQYFAAAHKGSEIVALAGYRPWTNEAGDVCVLTRPDQRGNGFGTMTARAVARRAHRDGKLLLYQTLESNLAAMEIARRIGFQPYARHVAVRLTAHPIDI